MLKITLKIDDTLVLEGTETELLIALCNLKNNSSFVYIPELETKIALIKNMSANANRGKKIIFP
jgi:hypothetical protein